MQAVLGRVAADIELNVIDRRQLPLVSKQGGRLLAGDLLRTWHPK